MAAYSRHWVEEHELSEHARTTYRAVLESRIVPRFGNSGPADLNTRDIANFLRDVQDGSGRPPR